MECADATEWCGVRGFNAVFKPGRTLASGRASCGVAVLVAQRDDIGVTEPELTLTADESPRIMAPQLAIPGLDPTLLANAYFEDAMGLNELNRVLLAKFAIWQQEFGMQVIGGGDFNIPAAQLSNSSEFWRRSRLQLVAPSEPTYTTATAATTIDYFVVSATLVDQVVRREVLTDFPLSPHSSGQSGH